MTINKQINGSEALIAIEGRLDTTTAPDLDNELQGLYGQIENLIFDFANLEYISSAGLRVLLSAQKNMNKQGKMSLRNVSENVMEVLEITGFSDILTIE